MSGQTKHPLHSADCQDPLSRQLTPSKFVVLVSWTWKDKRKKIKSKMKWITHIWQKIHKKFFIISPLTTSSSAFSPFAWTIIFHPRTTLPALPHKLASSSDFTIIPLKGYIPPSRTCASSFNRSLLPQQHLTTKEKHKLLHPNCPSQALWRWSFAQRQCTSIFQTSSLKSLFWTQSPALCPGFLDPSSSLYK